MSDYIFVDSDTNMERGPAARKSLENFSDSRYLTPSAGITAVPRERWALAQAYEAHTWLTGSGLHAVEDRNANHRAQFNGYRALNGHRFAHAIELGCGPFTNLRWIAAECEIVECSLLYPLLSRYLSHPNCRYKNGFLNVSDRELAAALGKTVVHRGVRRLIRRIAPRLLSSGVSVAETFCCPIEEMRVKKNYDLVVMINVIEHCYDVDQILGNILALLPIGGIFVFSDKFYDHARISAMVDHYYDAGHPLRVDKHVLEKFMTENFDNLHMKIVPVQEAITEETTLEYEEFYFIGRKIVPTAGIDVSPA